MKVDFETVWERIKTHQGDRFTTIKGKIFTYEISGDVFIVQENRNSRPQKSQFKKAFERSPLRDLGELDDIWGKSYVYSVLTDRRIIKKVESTSILPELSTRK